MAVPKYRKMLVVVTRFHDVQCARFKAYSAIMYTINELEFDYIKNIKILLHEEAVGLKIRHKSGLIPKSSKKTIVSAEVMRYICGTKIEAF